jgi:hypothetical protein
MLCTIGHNAFCVVTTPETISITPDNLKKLLEGVSKTKLVLRYEAVFVASIAFATCGILWEYQKLKNEISSARYEEEIQTIQQQQQIIATHLKSVEHQNAQNEALIKSQENFILKQKKQIESEHNNNKRSLEKINKLTESLTYENNQNKKFLKFERTKNNIQDSRINTLNSEITIQGLTIKDQRLTIYQLQKEIRKNNEIYFYKNSYKEPQSLTTQMVNQSINYINEEQEKKHNCKSETFEIKNYIPYVNPSKPVTNSPHCNIQNKSYGYMRSIPPIAYLGPQYLLSKLMLTSTFLRLVKKIIK